MTSFLVGFAGDIDKIRKAIVGGSLGPLLMFLVWNAVILGSVPKDAGLVAEAAGGVFDPLQVCYTAVIYLFVLPSPILLYFIFFVFFVIALEQTPLERHGHVPQLCCSDVTTTIGIFIIISRSIRLSL